MALIDTAEPPAAFAAEIEPLALRRVDAEFYARAVALAAALSAAEGLRATVRTEHPAEGCWLSGAATLLAVERMDGTAVLVTPERPAALAALIDRLDVVLDRVEAALGVVVEFDATVMVPADGSVAVSVEWDGGRIALVPLAAAPPILPVRNPDARLPVALAVAGPRLGVDEAATIGLGDLLLLPAGRWPAKLRSPGREERVGHYGPDMGDWIQGDTMADADTTTGGFTVATTLSLPPVTATVAELEALRPGATIAIGPVTAGLMAELRVAGRMVAQGEIVRLGEQYALLVTDLPPAPAAAPPPGEED